MTVRKETIGDDIDHECTLCGGDGFLDECECSLVEDICCCLEPTPRECPKCAKHRTLRG